MNWTNAFDIGECTVKVSDLSAAPRVIYSAVMAKGDSVDFTDADTATDFTIAVSADGSVSLSYTTTGPSLVGKKYEVDVIPSYPLIPEMRLVDLALNANFDIAAGYTDDAGGGVDVTGFNPPAPDPLDFTSIPDARVYFGLYAYGQAS